MLGAVLIGFGLEHAGKACARFVERAHQLGRRGQEHTQEGGLQGFLGWQFGQRVDLIGVQWLVVQGAGLDGGFLEFFCECLDYLGGSANVDLASDYCILPGEGMTEVGHSEIFGSNPDKGIFDDMDLGSASCKAVAQFRKMRDGHAGVFRNDHKRRSSKLDANVFNNCGFFGSHGWDFFEIGILDESVSF